MVPNEEWDGAIILDGGVLDGVGGRVMSKEARLQEAQLQEAHKELLKPLFAEVQYA